MSENEGSEMEVEEQSEDGELTKSPQKHSPMPLSKDMVGSFGISDDEADDTADSLDIKPPQATVLLHHKSSRSSNTKRDKHSDRSSGARREHIHGSKSDVHRKSHHRSREHRERHEERMREKHHHRYRDRREHKPIVDRGERVLEDLRERLLDKRRSESERRMKMERRERERRVIEEDPPPPPPQILPPPPRETPREKAERLEKELRRERLLEADREMARQKDAYRRELEARRERQNIEKEKERTMRELAKKRERSESHDRKKHRGDEVDENKEIEAEGVSFLGGLKNELSQQVVTVSDDSEEEEEEEEEDDDDDDEEEEDGGIGSGVENNKNSLLDGQGQVLDDGEVSSLGEEDEDEESESTSATEEEAGDTEESVRRNTDTEEPYSNHGSPSARVEQKSPVESEASQNHIEDVKQEVPEAPEKPVDENGMPFINDVSPKSDIVLQDSLPPYLPAIQGCRSVEEFQCLNRIEEGTYGVVYRARDKRTNEVVALKRLKVEKEKEGFPITSLREINTLLKAQHPNIVTVREIVVGSNMDKIFIVMDYVEHDLKSLMETMKQKKQRFIPGEVKCLMLQLLRAVAHLHDNWILHRDLKTSNLLLSHKGILKVGDFGLAREYGSPLKGYSPTVVTLWYRAPELLLGTKEYSTPIDMWSVGCIFGEFLSMEALFPGKTEADQLNRIFKDLGTPNERIWPGLRNLPAAQMMSFSDYPSFNLRQRFGTMITEVGMDLIKRFLTYDPVQRVTAEDALRHAYFNEAPLPIDPNMFPTWPAKSEQGHRKVAASPKPPPGGHEYKKLGDDEEMAAGGFHMGLAEKRHIPVGGGFSLKFDLK